MNHLDIWVRKGLPGVPLPHILGSDIAGEIVETGEYVTGFTPGQRVLLAPMSLLQSLREVRGWTAESVSRVHRSGQSRGWRRL